MRIFRLEFHFCDVIVCCVRCALLCSALFYSASLLLCVCIHDLIHHRCQSFTSIEYNYRLSCRRCCCFCRCCIYSISCKTRIKNEREKNSRTKIHWSHLGNIYDYLFAPQRKWKRKRTHTYTHTHTGTQAHEYTVVTHAYRSINY